MELNEYQNKARSFAAGGGGRLEYALLGLAGEAGEVCEKVAKFVREHDLQIDQFVNIGDRDKLIKEIGDCLWMVANVAACLGCGLEEVARLNIEKLDGRVKRGTIVGEGDER